MTHSIVKENLNCFKVLGIVKRAIEHCWEGIHGEEYQVLWAYVRVVQLNELQFAPLMF